MLRLCPSYLPDFCLRNGFQGPSPSKGLRWGWTTSYFTGSPSCPSWRLKWNLLSSSAQESLPASMTSQRQLGMASRWHSQLHQHPWVHPITSSLLKCSLMWSSSTETESFLPHTWCFTVFQMENNFWYLLLESFKYLFIQITKAYIQSYPKFHLVLFTPCCPLMQPCLSSLWFLLS